jgi:alkylhydroperoxidase/carboxymuconolactone decarboxylase family protein YurZ
MSDDPNANSQRGQTTTKKDRGLSRAMSTHFRATLGAVPRSIEVLAEHAPGALTGYLAMRETAYDANLDAGTRELLFIALDVAAGHVDGAKAHVDAAIDAGVSVAAIAQALVITMMVAGIHTWSQWGHEVVAHAAERARSRG